MSNLVKEFNDYRTRLNDVIISKDNPVIERLWNLDTNTYAAGALDVKTKELPGLVVRLLRMLRCDDCIKYHLGKSYEPGITPGSYMKYLLWPISLVAPLLFRYEKGGRIRGGITGY